MLPNNYRYFFIIIIEINPWAFYFMLIQVEFIHLAPPPNIMLSCGMFLMTSSFSFDSFS